jgi:glucan 1,3-beta-glucosidase
VYELASGWIFWSHSNQLGAPWSWSQSAAQNWIPQDPTEKIWPFYTNASSYCLHTYNPIDGDQNLPAFPGYANNISNIDIAMVQLKNATVAVSDTTSTNTTSASSSYGSSPTTIAIASTSSHITSTPSSTTSNALAATTSAKSGANKRTSILALLGIPLLGTIILFST